LDITDKDIYIYIGEKIRYEICVFVQISRGI